jgi:hypothetical protein
MPVTATVRMAMHVTAMAMKSFGARVSHAGNGSDPDGSGLDGRDDREQGELAGVAIALGHETIRTVLVADSEE